MKRTETIAPFSRTTSRCFDRGSCSRGGTPGALARGPRRIMAPEQPALTYAAAAKRAPPVTRQYQPAVRREASAPQYAPRPEQRGTSQTDVWRTAGRRQHCYHCGEADHIYRLCPYRQLGLCGFMLNDPRPRNGVRSREIEEYPRRSPSPVPSQPRGSLSLSPRRHASPLHHSRRNSLSPLSCRENCVQQRLEVTLPKTDEAKLEPPRTQESSHSNDTQQNGASVKVSSNLNVIIDGLDATALIDTSADYCVLSGKLFRRLRKVMTRYDGSPIRTAGSHLIMPTGGYAARVKMHGETCPLKFIVLQDCSRDIIIGMDFLCEYIAVMDLGEDKLTL